MPLILTRHPRFSPDSECHRTLNPTNHAPGWREGIGSASSRSRKALCPAYTLAMLDKGHGIKTTARSLGVSVSTLRRRLREAGEWPRQPGRVNGVQNPPAQV